MKYIEITVSTCTGGSELVADILWDYSFQGVAISDANDIKELQKDKTAFWDYIDDEIAESSGGEVLVKGFVAADRADGALKEIQSRLFDLQKNAIGLPLGSLECIAREIEGDEWKEIWKQHFRPIPIGGVVVCPEWIKYDKKAHETVVYIDSSMAFGTGEHETTSMCLQLLQKYIKPDCGVLDVGCGSGILGITALLLGAKSACMTDIDGIAVSSATHNATVNGVHDRCKIMLTDLIEKGSIKAELITANITANVLIRLSAFIKSLLKAGGILILSGIIHQKLGSVKEEFLAAGLKLKEHIAKGEWNSLVFEN